MFQTKLCTLLGIELPIFGAPMGFISGPELAAAVSNAGGLGIMSFSANPPAVLRDQIRRLRALTDKPYGVKQTILNATENDTLRTTLFGFGWPNAPHRTLRTSFVERWLPEEARGSEQRSDEPQIGQTIIGGQTIPLLRFMGFPPTPDAAGDLESMDFLAGQSVGLVRQITPAAEVIREIVDGARQILTQLAQLAGSDTSTIAGGTK